MTVASCAASVPTSQPIEARSGEFLTNHLKGSKRLKTLRPLGFWLKPKGRLRWARQDLNLQPTDYESAALTGLSYGPAVILI